MGKRILITGATRGLGRALACQFRELGHIIIGCGRSENSIAQLRRQFGPPSIFDAVDVSSDPAVAAWAQRVLDDHGPPDILINNAAIINRNAPLWEISADEFDPVIDINIKGVANTIRHFTPAMIAQRRGVIVNLSSGWGRSASAEVAPYCATKWAVEGLTRALAAELPAGMAAVALNPGIIDTDMLRSTFGNGASSYPSAEQWSHGAANDILNMTAADNGAALTVA